MDLMVWERQFLKTHGISEDVVFDARGMTKKERERYADENSMSFFVGKNCVAGGHRLRTAKPGHCIVCDPSKIAYKKRHRAPGYVYIAASSLGKPIKIGSTDNVGDREKSLNGDAYGGVSTWKIICYAHVPEKGVVETAVRSRLVAFRVQQSYWKDDRVQVAQELYQCSYADAREALDDVIDATTIVIENSD